MTANRRLARELACALLAAASAVAAACGGNGDPVRDSIDAMAKAANARDESALFSRVASNFEAGDGSSLADARSLVQRAFAAYEMLDVKVSNVQIERSEGAARVRFRADMSGQPRKIGGLDGLLPSSAKYDFDVRMVPDGGTWKVAWAQWTPAS
jgi:NAD(P)-dependent dehydrogenase (short-subunit alcohol dehydrogenase family)